MPQQSEGIVHQPSERYRRYGDDELTINDTVALDIDVMSVLQNKHWEGDAKYFQYRKTLDRYAYKQDPDFKPYQYQFEAEEEQKNKKKEKKSIIDHLWTIAPGCIGPIVGLFVTWFLKQ
jgi:hypothetical protein